MWSKRCRVIGTPVAGSCCWHRLCRERGGANEALNSSPRRGPGLRYTQLCSHPSVYQLYDYIFIFPRQQQPASLLRSAGPYLMAELRPPISSRSLCASSWSCARSCCTLPMYSAVFCSVVALLICGHGGVACERDTGPEPTCPPSVIRKLLQQGCGAAHALCALGAGGRWRRHPHMLNKVCEEVGTFFRNSSIQSIFL